MFQPFALQHIADLGKFIGMSIVDRVGRRKLALSGIPVMVIGLTWAVVSVYCEFYIHLPIVNDHC